MSIKNYKFVSPGVQVQEIDNSQLPNTAAGIGPLIIGRAQSGPSLRPVTVNSFSEFVEVFGNPVPGGEASDVWRTGNLASPMYGTYAAQAYLKNSSPLSFVRLLGDEDPQATSAGQAGWKTDFNVNSGKGAYGLFIFNSGSTGELNLSGTHVCALSAIFYTDTARTIMMLSGTTMAATGSGTEMKGTNIVVRDNGSSKSFTMIIKNARPAAAGSPTVTSSFNFDLASSKYIRKVFNTNPQLMNSAITNDNGRKNYFLGETFNRHLAANITSSTTYAALVPLYNTANTLDGGNHLSPNVAGQTPMVIACDPNSRVSGSAINWNPNNAQNLFNFVALGNPGDWTNRNIKISIQDITPATNESNPYGTFTVVVRHLSDSDNVVQLMEVFPNCDLNPNSLAYVARKVGDKYRQWSASKRRYEEYGNWDNRSRHVRIVMNSDIDAGIVNAELLPFGCKGILKYNDITVYSGLEGGYSTTQSEGWLTGSNNAPGGSTGTGSADPGDIGLSSHGIFMVTGLSNDPLDSNSGLTASVLFPAPELRVSASDGNLSNPKDAYFGYQTSQTAGGTRFDQSNYDLLRPRGGIVDVFASGSNNTEMSTTFTLDDITQRNGTGVWVSGSHASGLSITSRNAISGVLDAGYDRFTIPMYGGFDGLDITEMDPFRNTLMVSATERGNSPFYSIKKAIDTVADPEVIEMNLASVPGITQDGLTTHLINTCEDRADSLAVIDLPGSYVPRCTYYPWVQARDTMNGAIVWMPPSVAAIGTFSSSQRKTQVWFAPAGFNRGGLTEGAAGIPVVGVSQQLTKKERDQLYDANINPIAKFPAEGIVVFGQKTLQVTPSALDRINVRRLLIYLKKRISRVATQVLFDPNVEVTWDRFKSLAEPILQDAQANFGLSEYRLVLDSSTTTPELIDRNIMYAKVFLKPTRAIEFIAIDFNIARTGASFAD